MKFVPHKSILENGGWYRIRTYDPLLVRQMLSPTELITHKETILVGHTRFERVTSCMSSKRSNQLS